MRPEQETGTGSLQFEVIETMRINEMTFKKWEEKGMELKLNTNKNGQERIQQWRKKPQERGLE